MDSKLYSQGIENILHLVGDAADDAIHEGSCIETQMAKDAFSERSRSFSNYFSAWKEAITSSDEYCRILKIAPSDNHNETTRPLNENDRICYAATLLAGFSMGYEERFVSEYLSRHEK